MGEPPTLRTYIDRAGARDVAEAIEQAKRLGRQGWRLTLLEEVATGDIVTLGIFEDGAEPEPDRRGQFELAIE